MKILGYLRRGMLFSRKRAIPFYVIALIIIITLMGSMNYARSDGSVQQSASSLFAPNLLPKSPPLQSNFYVVKPGGTFQFTDAALEGLVARTFPQIYLETGSDAFWLNYTSATYGLNYQTVSSTNLLERFKSYFTDGSGNVKIIVFDSNDPIAPAQENMAMTLTGIYGALPVASNDLSTFQSIFGSNNINTLYDLRTVNSGGEFTDKLSAYTWLWDNFGAMTSKQLIGLNPGSYTLSDYLVEFKAFAFEFSDTSSITSSESSFASSVISTYPENTPAVGFFELGGEVNTITFLSTFQILMVPSSSVADLSFYSGLPTISLQQIAPKSITYDPSKTYVMFSFTQGNALAFDFYGNLGDWQAIDPTTNLPYREEIPSTFQTSPFLAEVAPPIIRYWYSTMYPEDSFMTGGSAGAGYDYPDLLPNLSSWLAIAAGLDSNAGLNNQFILLSSARGGTPTEQTIVSTLSPSALYLRQNVGGLPTTVSGVPLFYATFDVNSKNGVTLSQVVSEIQSASSGGNQFVYVFLDAQNPGYPFIQQVEQTLGSNYVLVNSAQLTNLYLQSIGRTSTTSSTTTPTISSSTTTASSSTTTASSSTTTASSSTTTASSSTTTASSSTTTASSSTTTASSSTTTTTSMTTTTTTRSSSITTSSSSSTTSSSSSTVSFSSSSSSSTSTKTSRTKTTTLNSSSTISSTAYSSNSSSSSYSTSISSSTTALSTTANSDSSQTSQSSTGKESTTTFRGQSSIHSQARESTSSTFRRGGSSPSASLSATHYSIFAYEFVLLGGLPLVVGLTIRRSNYGSPL